MHEHHITQEIMAIIMAECHKRGIKNPKTITVEVGELSTYTEDSIKFYFESMREGILKHAELNVVMVPGHEVNVKEIITD